VESLLWVAIANLGLVYSLEGAVGHQTAVIQASPSTTASTVASGLKRAENSSGATSYRIACGSLSGQTPGRKNYSRSVVDWDHHRDHHPSGRYAG
jgi:hypothetical protein